MAVATVLVRVDVMVMALLAVLAVLAVLGFSCCNAECKLRPGALVSSAGATATTATIATATTTLPPPQRSRRLGERETVDVGL